MAAAPTQTMEAAGIFGSPEEVDSEEDDSEDDEEAEEQAVASAIAKPRARPRARAGQWQRQQLPRRTSSRVQKKKEGVEPDMRSSGSASAGSILDELEPTNDQDDERG